MRISLVVATIDRTDEPARLLASLSNQEHDDWEVIIVDQNPDDRLSAILDRFSDLPVRRIRAEQGASRARNLGLEVAVGEVVGFPDDDCWYPPTLVSRVAACFRDTRPDGLTGRQVSPEGRPAYWFSDRPEPVHRFNVWRTSTASTIWVRRQALREVGGFDDRLGPGADSPWQAAEDIELVLRLVEAGYRIEYHPTLEVHHPETAYDERAPRRALAYGRAVGRVLRLYGYPTWFVASFLIRPLGGTLFSLMTLRPSRARFHWALLRGRLLGYLS